MRCAARQLYTRAPPSREKGGCVIVTLLHPAPLLSLTSERVNVNSVICPLACVRGNLIYYYRYYSLDKGQTPVLQNVHVWELQSESINALNEVF